MTDKMVMIVYNEALDMEVMEALEKSGELNYTKIPGVFGRGKASGIHLGTDIWPGKNTVLFAACTSAQARTMLATVRSLREALGKEGVKAFVLPLEEMT